MKGDTPFASVSLFLQKEDLQIYEKYCQNKPRSEALWRQCGDSTFFQVTVCFHWLLHNNSNDDGDNAGDNDGDNYGDDDADSDMRMLMPR